MTEKQDLIKASYRLHEELDTLSSDRYVTVKDILPMVDVYTTQVLAYLGHEFRQEVAGE